jgi:uncharacterized protein (DUF779 family)
MLLIPVKFILPGSFIKNSLINKMETKIARLSATENALEVIQKLADQYGPLMFYQAGGCCEGTQPQCFEKGGFFPDE